MVLSWFPLIALFDFILVGRAQDPTSNLDPSCTSRFNRTEGYFATINFPDLYPENIVCGWIIESPEAAADFLVNFDWFELEASKRCSMYDHVMIYRRANGQLDWEVIGFAQGYCGKQDPFLVSTTSKQVLVKFVSDATRRFSGFNATYRVQVTQQRAKITCLGLLDDKTCNRSVITEEEGTFTVSCETIAIPPATFLWQTKNISGEGWLPIDYSIVKNEFPNGSIQFYNVRMEDSNMYRCTASNKHGNMSEVFQLTVREKCRCPKEISTNWYNYPPYTPYVSGYNPDGSPIYGGIFYHLIQKVVDAVCGTCAGGHGKSIIMWDHTKNKKKGLSQMKYAIEDGSYDLSFPISGGKLDNKYRGAFWFLPLVESPGVAFIVIRDDPSASAMAIFSTILRGWPILVLTVVMAILAGIIMWMLDTYWNEQQFPRTFSQGVIEGFWWAFVTMTTVGYGDIAPVGVPGRIFAIVWILTGLVIIAIFTGFITTSLTVVTMENNVKLYGATAGAINDTAEYRLGVVKNAEMKNYSNFEELQQAMVARSLHGVLVDAYVATHNKDIFSGYRTNNVFKTLNSYGLVLGKRLSTPKTLYDQLLEYVERNQNVITQITEENTDAIEDPQTNAATQKASELFNPSSTVFVKSVVGSCVILLLLTLGGLLFEYGYLKPRHRMIEAAKNLEMVESLEVKEMALRAKLLKDTLLAEVQEFYDRWAEKLGNLTRKHKEEQRKLLKKGTSARPTPQRKAAAEAVEPDPVELDGTDGLDRLSSSSSSNSNLPKKATTNL